MFRQQRRIRFRDQPVHHHVPIGIETRAVIDRDRNREPAQRALAPLGMLDGPIELDYYRNGGILPAVLRRLARESGVESAGT